MKTILSLIFALLAFCPARARDLSLFARPNLVAWCIVPFDAKKRTPDQRAQMLRDLGLKRFAYDWRAEHIPTFADEIAACRRYGIDITAWWFPSTLDQDAKTILGVLKTNKVRTQLWVTHGPETGKGQTQRDRVAYEVTRLRPIVEAAAQIGCSVGLYHHGGWFGDPTNAIQIIQALNATNVGFVFNFHHAHHQIPDFPSLLETMKPYLLAINLNGMVMDGDKTGKKILTLGAGTHELSMLQTIVDSGWRGPVGIIDHRPETDSAETLRENLLGLDTLLSHLR